MAQGGARGRSGPPPNPNALRRDRDTAEWVTLPARRDGDPPAWPLASCSDREAALWAAEWSRPQACMWEANGQEVEVALYVRRLVEAEVPGSPIAAGTLVRQMQESLGLSIPGLLRNRWRIESGAEPVAETAPGPARSRRRLVVVDAVAGA